MKGAKSKEEVKQMVTVHINSSSHLVKEGFSSLFIYQSENKHLLLDFSPGFESTSFQSSSRYQMVSKLSRNHFLEETLRMSWKKKTSSA